MKIHGHEQQRENLQRLRARATLAATLLFAGISGIGKKRVARELAKSILCHEPSAAGACERCAACKLFEAGNHPDLAQIEAGDKERWDTAEVRALLGALQMNPFMGKTRVTIINDAEIMVDAAANALLKSLEEPRAGNYFILVSANPSKLPSPVLSRCQRWNFEPLNATQLGEVVHALLDGDAELREALLQAAPGQQAELVELADGSLSNFLELSAQRELLATLKEQFTALCRGDGAAALQFATQLAKNREQLAPALRIMRSLARNFMLQSKDSPTQARSARLLSNILEAERAIFERNISAQYVLSFIFLSFAAPPQLSRMSRDDSLLENFIL